MIKIQPSDEKQFVYSVTPIDKGDGQDVDWEGTISSIRKSVTSEVAIQRKEKNKAVKVL